jgi:hypothetical protein
MEATMTATTHEWAPSSPNQEKKREWYYYGQIDPAFPTTLSPEDQLAQQELARLKAAHRATAALGIVQRQWASDPAIMRYEKNLLLSTPLKPVFTLHARIGWAAVEEELTQYEPDQFIRKEDIRTFFDYAVSRQVYVSVRRTGGNSITRLGEGGACKPHAILDKSIKPASISKEQETLAKLQKMLADTTIGPKIGWEVGVFPSRAFRNYVLPQPIYDTVDRVYWIVSASRGASTTYSGAYGQGPRPYTSLTVQSGAKIDIVQLFFNNILSTTLDAVDGGYSLPLNTNNIAILNEL